MAGPKDLAVVVVVVVVVIAAVDELSALLEGLFWSLMGNGTELGSI